MTTRLLVVDVDAVRNELDEMRAAWIDTEVSVRFNASTDVDVNLTAIEAAVALVWSDKYPALDLLRDEIPR